MTSVINLYGGPGIGKSTAAAYIYYLLKSQHQSVELVREYVKVWAWDNRKIRAYDQPHIVGKQMRDESLLYDKTDWLVTDSPIPLNQYYADTLSTIIGNGIRSSIRSFLDQCTHDGHVHINILLKRTYGYQQAGRYETSDQALAVDRGLRVILEDFGLNFVELEPDEETLKAYVDKLLEAHASIVGQ